MLFHRTELLTVTPNHSVLFYKVCIVHSIMWKFWIGFNWLAILFSGVLSAIGLMKFWIGSNWLAILFSGVLSAIALTKFQVPIKAGNFTPLAQQLTAFKEYSKRELHQGYCDSSFT